ncbi:FAD-dependent oxidoreductase [Mediterraneibacter glycyrrhizinilyticus]|uniref:FAD-dependent oxidoreductase n=1 Tax=Mediterraneibacter glycyrrhizinilyticus TaxID=342942 RepID=UPI0025AAF072|nr:FAD-dependent oxidoreductase [Mediterraneibacter glycyrrhizinilyticus]MDN0044829.1 FAD-dependent oxidoreductase [Mediterraneibacter glycyrrhizinilyticus]
MKSIRLRDDFYWTGIIDDQLRVFDIIMYTEFGTTYNSYVMKAGDKTVLFETAKAKFFDEYREKLQEVIDVHKIDYLVVSHTEPDHAGSVERLLDYSPQMKIIATGCALSFLKEIVNRDFVGIPARDGEKMVIGNRTLKFMFVPNLHWPDTMYTFIEEEQILVTCDSFGAHYCLPEVVSTAIKNEEDYQKALKYYYDCIIGPFKPFMLKALDRVEDMDISMICTGHGPVLVGDRIKAVMKQYREWSTVVNPNPKKTVIIPYVSAYGYTKSLAEKIAEGVRDSGDIDVRSYDMVEADAAKVNEELLFADGILLGTPTIVGEALKPIWDLTLGMFPATHGGKYAGAFGSYGWSGEGVPNITERLKQLKMKVSEGFRVRFKPSEADLVSAYEYGYQFGCVVQNKEPVKPKKKGARSLVKCLVCGEIFDSSLEICPVCGVGKENFVPVDVEETGFVNDTQEYYVILGNGAAGFNAAKAIRERDKTGSIVMISNEPYPSYNRPMLTKSIVAGLNADQIAIEGAGWYEENHVYQMLGKQVVSVDMDEKEVRLDSGEKIRFTRLIYALGSECFIPPMEGHGLPEVVAIRRLSDVEKVERLMEKAANAVVIGGGVLGLEAAWELKKAGLSVTVIEVAPVLMGRQLDNGSAEILKEIAAKHDISIRTGVSVAAIEGEEHVSGVRLAGGETVPAELVIVSAGVRAKTDLAQEMGLQIGRAVKTDSHMETNVPGVYACGDCAEYEGVNYAIWPEAVEQGRIAGANAAGEELEYEPVEAALTFHGMNTALFAAGDNGKNPNLLYKTVEYRDMGKGQYRKYYFLNNRLSGVILIGDLSEMAKMTEALRKHASYKEVIQ